MKMLRRLLLLGLFVGFLIAGWRFAAANAEPTPVDLLLLQADGLPLWFVLLAAFSGGGALVGVVALVKLARSSMESRRYRKAVVRLESEVHQLRNLPLVAEPEEFDRPSSVADEVLGAEPATGPRA